MNQYLAVYVIQDIGKELTHGRVEISFPAAATPMTVETPHPLWQDSSAARMTSTCMDTSEKCQQKCTLVFPMTTHVACRVKGEVKPTIREFDEVILDTFSIEELLRVDKIGRAKLARTLFLCGIYVNCNHARRPDEVSCVDTTQANAAATEDSNR
jgi:hypothetical protein